MKTRVVVIAGLLLIGSLAVAGCNGDDDEDEDTGVTDTQVTDADVGQDTAADTVADTTDDTAADAGVEPSVTVEDQTVPDVRQVIVAEAVSDGPGWMVIHEEAADSETPGAVIGQAQLESGTNTDVLVDLQRDVEDGETLYAMLHHDTGEIGTYEFGQNGEDGPVQDDEGNIIVEPFEVTVEM